MEPSLTNLRTLSPVLLLAVENAYTVFSRYPAPTGMLDVCLGCCVSESVELEMRTLPLRQLSPSHFYEYNCSAKSSQQPITELKYLLPRLLELVALHHQIHHSTEMFLDRLGHTNAMDFSAVERDAISQFAAAFFADLLHTYPAPNGAFSGESMLSILLMMDIGGVNITPLLEHWLDTQEPGATCHFAKSTYWDFWNDHEITNAFSEDRPAYRAQIKDWILNRSNQAIFAEKMANLPPPPESTLSNACACGGHHGDIHWMVDAVFDHLTS